MACGLINVLEIGNRVWIDTDGDGIQDANEMKGLVGLPVALYNSAGVLIATDTSDAQGEYYFPTVRGDSLKPNTDYFVVFGQNQFDATSKQSTVNNATYANSGLKKAVKQSGSQCAENYQLSHFLWSSDPCMWHLIKKPCFTACIFVNLVKKD